MTVARGIHEDPHEIVPRAGLLAWCGLVVLCLMLPLSTGCGDTEEDLDRYVKMQMRPLLIWSKVAIIFASSTGLI